jgi:hypothetical protein
MRRLLGSGLRLSRPLKRRRSRGGGDSEGERGLRRDGGGVRDMERVGERPGGGDLRLIGGGVRESRRGEGRRGGGERYRRMGAGERDPRAPFELIERERRRGGGEREKRRRGP